MTQLTTEEKLDQLKSNIRKMEQVLVAFSGGVDSTFLLSVASEVLHDRVIALTAVSPSLPAHEKKEAIETAKNFGVHHLLVESHEMENPDYFKNPTNRCYFCKTELYRLCREEAFKLGIDWILDGFTVDDASDYRPGFLAKKENAISSPLLEVGLTKVEIRELSHKRGLATWDKSASPCLSSRIPYGIRVTPEILRKIENLENFLRGEGLKNFRVRYHEKILRLEIESGDFDKFTQFSLRQQFVAKSREEGFEFVTLDLEEFRSGRLNESMGLKSAVNAV